MTGLVEVQAPCEGARAMRGGGWAVAIVWVVSASVAGAQTAATEQSIEAQLQAAPFVMLRGMYAGDKLSFDAEGNLVGDGTPTLFSLSAIRVTGIHLSDSALEVDGDRAGLEVQVDRAGPSMQPALWGKGRDRVRAVPLGGRSKEGIEVTIARDSAHSDALATAVEKVFSIGIDEGLMRTAPSCWQLWVRHQLHPQLPPLTLPQGVYGPNAATVADRNPAGIHNPILAYAPDPVMLPAAKPIGFQGMSVIGVIVDAQGRPGSEWVEQPAGMGLDESAIVTVMQYRFRPATIRGKPVPTEITIEVEFRR